MSWQKTACLLLGKQVCLAIMVQTWPLSVLGWVPGIITMHKFIMKYPQIKDIYVFGQSRCAYVFSAFTLLANNVLLIGFHVLTSAKVLNTLSDHSLCTAVFSVIAIIMGIILSIPRTLHHVSFISMLSYVSGCMGISILLFLIFAGVTEAPLFGYKRQLSNDGPVKTYAFPLPSTTWVQCMNVVLTITFLWVPQILLPSFIAEMERPQDFPKALGVLTFIPAILFIVSRAIGFRYLGQYATAPAFGNLGVVAYKKASSGFVIVPTLIIGVIYANVTAKFIYTRMVGKPKHANSNTFVGWGVWFTVMAIIWVLGFVFAEVIPSMGDFLSLLSAAFDSFFGFIYFAIAYRHLNRGRMLASLGQTVMTLINVFIMLVGLFMLGLGLYAAVEAIIADYSGAIMPAFTGAKMAI
ncbi:Amino acid transporter transmembrane [Penicillium capsulatum]|uniref:Amino acid transporter transmembrane n=1 Tax=Penicillium capsulatum TaxID=69766 RepID=A0A9W9IP10_9EURO|nr:Amino acid transporter transmembrane [Penicillium capsulatum]KAJ6123009.1 Amino acid transporter transmembrane [Penicillium capsulatum]